MECDVSLYGTRLFHASGRHGRGPIKSVGRQIINPNLLEGFRNSVWTLLARISIHAGQRKKLALMAMKGTEFVVLRPRFLKRTRFDAHASVLNWENLHG